MAYFVRDWGVSSGGGPSSSGYIDPSVNTGDTGVMTVCWAGTSTGTYLEDNYGHNWIAVPNTRQYNSGLNQTTEVYVTTFSNVSGSVGITVTAYFGTAVANWNMGGLEFGATSPTVDASNGLTATGTPTTSGIITSGADAIAAFFYLNNHYSGTPGTGWTQSYINQYWSHQYLLASSAGSFTAIMNGIPSDYYMAQIIAFPISGADLWTTPLTDGIGAMNPGPAMPSAGSKTVALGNGSPAPTVGQVYPTKAG